MSTLLVVGAGGHGVVVAEAAALSRCWKKIVFVDDKYPDVGSVANWAVVGKPTDLVDLRAEYDEAIVAIGDSSARLSLIQRVESAGFNVVRVFHPAASISNLSEVGKGCVVLAGAIINARTEIGIGCIVNTGSTVDHDCRLGAGVHVAPGANLAADVSVGERSWLGIGCSVREQIEIGKDVTVGAGAAVVANVADGQTVVGVPARPTK